ncbi:MAG: glycoside hydrolase [Ruminococcus sp.]|nr:glycoside hydrolase [Ruminococcus sp.]
MIKKSFAALLAGICTVASASSLPVATGSAEDAYAMNVSVRLDGSKKEISPYIYGVNEYANSSNLKTMKVNSVRQGGNRLSGYNWETNYSSAGEDWINSNDDHYGKPSNGPAYAAASFSKTCEKYNIPYKMTTLQMCGYVAADMKGTVKENEVAPSERWNKVEFRKDGELSLEPDLTDDTVYMDEYVNYLVKTFGDASTKTGFQAFSLDNEPALWNDTHPRMHPEEMTNKELVSKSVELAKVVKEIDPKAEVFGPAFWGMLPCIQAGESGNGFTDPEWQAVKNDYDWYLDFYLKQMADAEKESGKRLLDVIDVHYYSQGLNSDDDILQAARSLYDPTYVESSWLQPTFKQFFPFIPAIKKSIDKYYPGTKIAITEYNLGNISKEKETGKDIRTGIAEAEALGCFAANDVYFATYWGTIPDCPFVESAINLYTNYDGKGAAFGDTLVEAETEDLSKSYAYAAINGKDDSQVTVVLANKDKTKPEKAVIELTGASSTYKSATVYAVTQDHSDIRVVSIDNEVKDNKVTVELPALSFAQVVLSDKESDAEIYVAPDIETKEIEYKFDELELSQNGFPMIPIEDKEHIKSIIINCTANCSTGAAWYCGGGGLCFNKLKSLDGATAYGWGNKSFGYSGSGDVEVAMDSTFTIPDPEKPDASLEVDADYDDTFIEFQDWWKSSANDAQGADVSVTYNTIKVVYEYDHTGEGSTTTSATTTSGTTTTTATTTASTGSSSTALLPAATLIGDANLDKKVTVADSVAILQSIANKDKYALKPEGAANADCCDPGDGITGKDALAIQKLDAKAIEKLPEISK